MVYIYILTRNNTYAIMKSEKIITAEFRSGDIKISKTVFIYSHRFLRAVL